ncbi:MAG: Gfo/Idh/MocA family oxidoreductase [Armatimonadetes bacterium]|nr:Gfo/Idh/MocA family oxidoreductase [Armatimonadota bacterium]
MKKATVAVVGCGYWGKNLTRNFYQLGALRLVCDSQPEAQTRAAEIAPGISIVADLARVLESDVDGIVIATPAATHFRLASAALAAGKDVFVEKPLSLAFKQGLELVRQAEGAGRILMVGHILEYHPACRKLYQLVREGELGKLYYIYSHRLSLGKVRREENILWSFAPHDVAAILRLAGSLPQTVLATGANYLQHEIADVTTTHLRFGSGVQAHIHVSWLHPFKEQRLVVIGSRKMAVFDGVTGSIVCYDQRVDIVERIPQPITGKSTAISVSAEEPLKLECAAFLQSVVDRTPPLTDGWSGLQTLAVLEAAQTSLERDTSPVALRDLFGSDILPMWKVAESPLNAEAGC